MEFQTGRTWDVDLDHGHQGETGDESRQRGHLLQLLCLFLHLPFSIVHPSPPNLMGEDECRRPGYDMLLISLLLLLLLLLLLRLHAKRNYRRDGSSLTPEPYLTPHTYFHDERSTLCWHVFFLHTHTHTHTHVVLQLRIATAIDCGFLAFPFSLDLDEDVPLLFSTAALFVGTPCPPRDT